MAISKERKNEILEQQRDWLKNSQAAMFTEYIGLTAKNLEQLRIKVREAGGELHVVKNTLSKLAFEEAGHKLPEAVLTNSTAIVFSFGDPAGMAKALKEFAKTSEFVKVKGATLGTKLITGEQVIALADLPSLDVLRAQLLGTISAPATRIARTLAEPGRQIAAVVKAYADKESTQAAA